MKPTEYRRPREGDGTLIKTEEMNEHELRTARMAAAHNMAHNQFIADVYRRIEEELRDEAEAAYLEEPTEKASIPYHTHDYETDGLQGYQEGRMLEAIADEMRRARYDHANAANGAELAITGYRREQEKFTTK